VLSMPRAHNRPHGLASLYNLPETCAVSINWMFDIYSDGRRGRRHKGPDMSKCILITGGGGFIGSHLADTLLAHGYQVRVLDELSPYDWLLPRLVRQAHMQQDLSWPDGGHYWHWLAWCAAY
jgi:hypothetical protein